MTIDEVLRVAGISLDARNTAVPADYYDPSKFPFYRTTGTNLLVDIEYANVPGVEQVKQVRADVCMSIHDGVHAH